MATNAPVSMDTLIAVKVLYQGHNKKFKIPLRDLGPSVLPDKLKALLCLHPSDNPVFERYSDSAGAYVVLDSDKPHVYKTLFRAAKAKLKLRLRCTMPHQNEPWSAGGIPPLQYPTGLSRLPRPAAEVTAPQTVQPPQAVPAPVSAVSACPFIPYKINEGQSAVTTGQGLGSAPIAYSLSNKENLAPLPKPFTFTESKQNPPQDDLLSAANLAYRPKEPTSTNAWVVFCNHCSDAMENEHYHCSICDGGDYDLCGTCVEAGFHCPGKGHWMVKRFVKNGVVVNSVTERVGPKGKPDFAQEMPGAFTQDRKLVDVEPEEATRTCNCCVKVLSEKEFVTCGDCDDYDLCLDCHTGNKHGHHPGHVFKPATSDTVLNVLARNLCNPGRHVRHSAVCDGCEKFIYGVRHKCLNCPDWDFCSECIKNAKFIHPRHRFVPIYEPLAEPNNAAVRHYGIYCDGPLCKDKENMSYIEGVRFKCAVCHDTDFCANCEAIPTNRHNRTHPLIKFKTPVRSVSVTTLGEDKNGVAFARMGDQPARKSTATETLPVPVCAPVNAATQVQTIVDFKPTEEAQPKPNKEKIEIRDLISEPVHQIKIHDLLSTPAPPVDQKVEPVKSEAIPIPVSENATPLNSLDAHFIRDTISDGTKVAAESQFVQVWTLRNPGPKAWPAGCSVRHVGGDNMLNLDNTQPLSQSELAEASESNVVGRPVEVGEEISFRVVLKAPKREGTAISYWRLKTADGIPFGHRLWCDIQVVAPSSPAPASPVPQPSPSSLWSTSEEVPQPSASPSSPSSSSSLFDNTKLRAQTRLEMKRVLEARARALIASKQMSQKKSVDVRDAERAVAHAKILQARRKAVERIYEEKSALFPQDRERLDSTARAEPVTSYSALSRLANAMTQRDMDTQDAVNKEQVKEEVAKDKSIKEEPQEEAAQSDAPSEPQPQASVMIFPQLEKESPASSTHEASAITASEQPTTQAVAVAVADTESVEEDEGDFFEDAESVEVLDGSSDDEDSFLTDEEYDILDASDEEMP